MLKHHLDILPIYKGAILRTLRKITPIYTGEISAYPGAKSSYILGNNSERIGTLFQPMYSHIYIVLNCTYPVYGYEHGVHFLEIWLGLT